MRARHDETERTRRCKQRRAFSLVELVIVVMIIGILASVAIPRLSRGSTDAAAATLLGDLTVIDKAIQLYAIEHRNVFPGPDASGFADQLTMYTSAGGATSATRTALYAYGPYLLQVPPAPAGQNAGSADVLIDTVNSPPAPDPAQPYGWIYNPNTGEFYLNHGSMVQAGAETTGGFDLD